MPNMILGDTTSKHKKTSRCPKYYWPEAHKSPHGSEGNGIHRPPKDHIPRISQSHCFKKNDEKNAKH